ncbi:hypothetical protein LIER_16566 [Lithospermum erythrorhizon]|uniref:Uncharacterized protein n=1 Tax=Lithospermum erythrorhizon TaxID=34254 RepID=A0AAV3Q9M5_LITER
MRDLSASAHSPLGQDQSPLLPADHVRDATPTGASGHSTTIVLPDGHLEVASALPQVPPSASPPALEPHTTRLSLPLTGGPPIPRKRIRSPLLNPRPS